MHWAYDYILDHKLNHAKDYPYVGYGQDCKRDDIGKGEHEMKKCVQVGKTVEHLVEAIRD